MNLLKTSTKTCLDVCHMPKDNVRSKNSKTLSVGQDIVNCIFFRWNYGDDKIKEFI